MTDNTDQPEGPRYKLASFLFGNVDKQGEIEEYKNDEDLRAINNIDQCHVKEVEETTRLVLSVDSAPTDESGSTLQTRTTTDVSVAPADYYDEVEAVPDENIDLKTLEDKDELISRVKSTDDDDYDDVPQPETDTSEPIHAVSTEVVAASSTESAPAPAHTTTSPVPFTAHSNPSSPAVANQIRDAGLQDEKRNEQSSIDLNQSPSAMLTEQGIKITDEEEDTSSMMPPPLHPAPISLSRQPLKSISARGPESPSGGTGSALSSPIPSRVDSPALDRTSTPSPLYDPGGLNTPLGSLMPMEYANVGITELFPHYDPDRTPRWSRLFRLHHAPSTYKEFIDRAPLINSLLAERDARNANRLHLVYDDYLDLGQIPLAAEVTGHDEVEELNTPLPPNSDCLAGHEKSWWRRAFAAALAEATNPTGRPNATAAATDASEPSRSAKSIGKTNPTTAGTGPNQTSQDTKNSADGAKELNGKDTGKTMSQEELRRGWRLGPAKYWYDQLGIPLDADISTWTKWRRSSLTTTGSNVPVSGAVETVVGAPGSTADTTPDVGPVKLEHAETSNEQTADDPGENETNRTDGVQDMERDDATVESRNGPVSETESKADFKSAAVSLNLNGTVQSRTSVKSPPERSRITCELPQNAFYPYQLINWEEDIIYDPQLSANKISASSKMNAAYAGWIPSQHCRTMAAFQDAYQGKFPYIVGSKALNGLNAANAVMEQLLNGSNRTYVPSNPPYSIFPVENEGILSDSWIYDIIYDSDLPPDQLPPPFLLTLDGNDENCLMDAVDDVQIAEAIGAARGLRQRQLTARAGDAAQDGTGATGNDVGLGLRGSDSRTDLLATGDSAWSQYGAPLNDSSGTGTSKANAPINRASLQVSFGLASTRGMLTGALAKAEHGAEKVKMILGKHGLLAEDDWQSEHDKLANSEVTHGSLVGDTAAHGDLIGADGSALASAAAAVSGIPPKDPLNLSNDEYYAIRSGALGMCGGLARCGPLQHSTPAVELWPPFFPTYMSSLRLRQFHRIPLKRYVRGPMAQYNVPFPVTNLIRHIQKKSREREEEKAATGGGEIFFMRTPADLSGTDGDVILCEFSEEFPPLMTQVGMASRVINYYRPLNPRDRALSPAPNASGEPPDLPYGSLVYVSGTDSPFLGVIRPGGCLQTLENNMYRAPIYPHTMPGTDFLLIRNRNGISIRHVQNVFTVGQEIPLMEVPGPNSKRANNFVRDFLQVFILRLFLRSTDEPKRIKIEEIRKAFPNHSESSVRKRLKVCADFRRTGSDASWWVLRTDYRLPSEEEVRYLVSPEDCCAHYSMLAAELRLKDAGYGEKSIFVLDENQEDEEEKEGQPKMEDEVRAAPWNTTRAYLASQRGGCFLELHGAADPTGCGEAFSYSKTSAKPGALFRQAGGEVARGLLKGKRTVTGTDADLRKLHLRDARALLRSFGISEADLKSFKRWEIIDMVRFTSTERAKQGEEEGSAKFARGNRLSMGEQVRCYREECQRIFDLQNRVLSNPELLSSDEEVSSEEDDEEAGEAGPGAGRAGHAGTGGAHGTASSSSIGGVRLSSLSATARSYSATMSRNIEAVISNRMSVSEFENRREEVDREKLKRALESGDSSIGAKRPRKTNPAAGCIVKGTGPDHSTDSNPGTAVGTVSNPTVLSSVYEASAQAAGAILDLAPPWPNATRKLLRIMRTYSEDGQQYTRTELVPWSPVVEIYLKIRQTRNDEFIHNFVDSDNQIREQQRKEKRRLQDQLRRLRKQQAQIRERGGVPGAVGGSIGSGAHRPGMSGADAARRRRRHKPPTSALVKMRCGACGQTGHMRTNKECPMYGKNVGSNVAGTAGDVSGARRGLDRSRGSRAGGLPGARGAADGLAKCDADAIAAAQALASRPVCELLAEQEEHEAADHKLSASGGSADPDGSSQDRSQAHREADESRDSIGETDMTVEGTKLKLHSNLTRLIQEQNRRNLKLKIHRQLLERLNAASEMVQSATASRRALASRQGASGSGSGLGRGRRSSLVEDEFPTGIKHRGNRRRIDPRVALNHIFEGIYKGLTQIPGYKIFMHPVKEKEWPNYYAQISQPMDLSQIRMKINENAYATREEFLADIRLIYNNSLRFNGRYSAYTETAMKMCSLVMEEFCHKELKLMRLESLVNPLLDEDDLVGLSFLLQQAIEAMRAVEHSRPFHTPVDKRRYPDYYKVISNPMDLSTLEKMVKENRFRSRVEFLNQVDLILSNCIQFNGAESPLSEIAKNLVDAARVRLEQDAEMLDTIEANIRSNQPDADATGETAQSESALNRQSERDSESASHVDPDSKRPASGSSGADAPSAGPSSSGGGSRTAKRRISCTTDSSRPHKMARISDSEANITAGSMNVDSPSVSFDTNRPVEPSGRSLRQRTTETWYGVDLEYDDDDDDDDNEEEEEQAADEEEDADAADVEDEPEDEDRSRKPLRSSLRKQANPEADEDDHDTSRPHPWVTDEESMADSVDRFNRLRGDEEQTWSSHPRTREGAQALREDSDHSPLPLSPSSSPTGSHPAHERVGHHEIVRQRSDEDEDDVDVRDDGMDTRMEAHSYSEDSMTDLPGWDESRHHVDDSQDAYSNQRQVTYIDEDTRFSMGETADQQLAALTDDLVAQDLQLTDSADGSSLSGEGGELCTDSDLAFLTSMHQTDGEHARSSFPTRRESSSEASWRNFGSRTAPDQSDNLERRRSDHVEFFISEGEDDSNDR